MKIKENSLIKILSNNSIANETFISMDTNGNIFIEDYKKLLEYQSELIQLQANKKILSIFGFNMNISSCSKHSASISGKITKIEISEANDV